MCKMRLLALLFDSITSKTRFIEERNYAASNRVCEYPSNQCPGESGVHPSKPTADRHDDTQL